MTAATSLAIEGKRERLPALDFLRFVAASMVVLYHYTFRGAVEGNYTTAAFPAIDQFTRYGYLGVDLFFIISGFVIFLTVDAGRGSTTHFAASRISRLYPAFWAAATLTFLVTLATGSPLHVGFVDYLMNLGMFPAWLGAPYVDGVYWTLETELQFYLLVVGYLLFFWDRIRVEWLLLTWLIVAVTMSVFEFGPWRLRAFLVVDSAPYFVGGCLFYLVWRDGWTRTKIALLVAACSAGMYYAAKNAADISSQFGTDISPSVSALVVAAGFAVFVALCLRPEWFRIGGRRATFLGALTYPLYLVHQNLGYLAINAVDPLLGPVVAVVVAISLALTLAYLINRFVERRYNGRVRRWLEPRLGILDRIATKTRGIGMHPRQS